MNFLVSENNVVKVCDFGLSRYSTEGNYSTLKKLRGTLYYISPEVCKGEVYTAKSDIYALGIVFWEMVYRCMFGKYAVPYFEHQFDNALQIVVQNPNGLRPTIPVNCPEKMTALLQSAWAGNPQDRPDCSTFITRLQECKEDMDKSPKAWRSVEFFYNNRHQYRKSTTQNNIKSELEKLWENRGTKVDMDD
jgi:serine/threonine protein kinase